MKKFVSKLAAVAVVAGVAGLGGGVPVAISAAVIGWFLMSE